MLSLFLDALLKLFKTTFTKNYSIMIAWLCMSEVALCVKNQSFLRIYAIRLNGRTYINMI